jgi:hypothetical protein
MHGVPIIPSSQYVVCCIYRIKCFKEKKYIKNPLHFQGSYLWTKNFPKENYFNAFHRTYMTKLLRNKTQKFPALPG